MKKIVAVICSITLVLSLITSTSFANANVQGQDFISSNESIINAVEPFVEVTKDGMIQLKNVPQDTYDLYNLSALQEHFDDLNAKVLNGAIVINSDLSIEDNTISIFAEYGTWTYHWWGYDRNFNNSQAIEFAEYCSNISDGAAIATGLTLLWPPIAGTAALTAGVFSLLGNRVTANNNGNGVYVGMTWVFVFNVEPL